jgi:hypothetical protein
MGLLCAYLTIGKGPALFDQFWLGLSVARENFNEGFYFWLALGRSTGALAHLIGSVNIGFIGYQPLHFFQP